jgi:hydrogenase nickel incorporation protein HypA/HybF
MHELSISQAILDASVRHAAGRRVLRTSVTIGALRQVVPETLHFYFKILARGTVCEGALLQPRLQPARLRCACGEEWELAELSFRCPRCAGADVTVLDGDELCVDSIEVEETACIAPR